MKPDNKSKERFALIKLQKVLDEIDYIEDVWKQSDEEIFLLTIAVIALRKIKVDNVQLFNDCTLEYEKWSNNKLNGIKQDFDFRKIMFAVCNDEYGKVSVTILNMAKLIYKKCRNEINRTLILPKL